ncbi:MAG: DUF4328 domain-containing protein, partial [Acidobacteriota bacterium]
ELGYSHRVSRYAPGVYLNNRSSRQTSRCLTVRFGGRTTPVKSIHTKARITLWALYLLAASAGALAISDILIILSIHSNPNAEGSMTRFEEAVVAFMDWPLLVYIVAFPVFGIAFLSWFYTAHKNLREVGIETKYRSGWAIGSFFIPILNLFRPYQVMKELWQGSEYLANPAGELGWQERNTGRPVGRWWTLAIVSSLAETFLIIGAAEEETTAAILGDAYKTLFGDLLDLATAIVTIMLVSRITSFQDAYRNRQDLDESELGRVIDPV